ncbi:glutaminase A [Psychrobacter sp. I-STPA6b]|uniref:glutaminase A n=1 Tax=Psychrobacter sp. I-STPA6b TaxID=2585718 RepID=UPI001D0CC3D6|nr:glutaminase A [Psychrobacter sp. I-STPA6b]
MNKNNLQELVTKIQQKHHQDKGGKNASYIPYLASVPAQLSALAVVTAEGEVYASGDSDYGFAIESISKVATLALALEDKGSETVRRKVGDSPTGLPFNSVMALELHQDKPLSPLVNAGAMATTSIIEAKDKEERWARILDFQRQMASERVVLSDEVNESEQTTNFHNRAIAWLLYSAEHMFCDPMEACEVYTRQCSTLINTVDLATMAATLAAGGKNPISQKQVIKPQNIPHILAEMMMEGFYEKSGDWAYTVGLPSKSGVGGGIMAVVPNVMGIAAFSPPLDSAGNSVRGQKMVHELAHTLGLNLFLPK